jgi:hypothetical protein
VMLLHYIGINFREGYLCIQIVLGSALRCLLDFICSIVFANC